MNARSDTDGRQTSVVGLARIVRLFLCCFTIIVFGFSSLFVAVAVMVMGGARQRTGFVDFVPRVLMPRSNL